MWLRKNRGEKSLCCHRRVSSQILIIHIKGQIHITNSLRKIQQFDIGAMKSLYSQRYPRQQSNFCNDLSVLFFSLEICFFSLSLILLSEIIRSFSFGMRQWASCGLFYFGCTRSHTCCSHSSDSRTQSYTLV